MTEPANTGECAVVTYEVIALRDAKKRDLPGPGYWGDEFNWGWGIWRCEDGIPVEYIGEDGGEPEDQTLARDWNWVPKALEAAYNLGRAHGDGCPP